MIGNISYSMGPTMFRPSPSALHPAHGPASPAPVALRLARQPERWAHLVEHCAGERRFSRIDLDDVEAWVISWAPGTQLGLHDHGGAAGALALVEGQLAERYGDRRTPGRLRTRILDAVTVVGFDPDHVHAVRNVGVVPAVSIHVYSPSLETMTFFAADPRDDRVVETAMASSGIDR
ncbi:MAG TPA: cysteine dioxygenase family protein [Acidimicrobiales bacterium]